MFNLPDLSFLQTPEWQQYIQGIMSGDPNATPPWMGGGAGAGFTPVPTNSYRVDGTRYTGPFAKQDVNPFRTVEGAGQYGTGLNASAGQLYDHFHRKVALDRQGGNPDATIADYGLKPAQRAQTIADFLARRSPQPIPQTEGGGDDTTTPPPPPTRPGNVPTDPNNPFRGPNFAFPRNGNPMSFDIAMQQFDRNNMFGQMGNINSNFQPPVAPTAPPAMTLPPMMRGAI
jgi:hypothetical protein